MKKRENFFEGAPGGNSNGTQSKNLERGLDLEPKRNVLEIKVELLNYAEKTATCVSRVNKIAKLPTCRATGKQSTVNRNLEYQKYAEKLLFFL